MLIRVKNNLDEIASYTFLSNTEAVGAASLRVRNINGFTASWAVQVGKTGEEQTEIKVLGTAVPSGTALSITGTTNYEHPADTPVFAVKYDQLIFLRSAGGTAGTATPITNGTISITPDHDFTQFDDTGGATTYAYRTQFRNSVTGDVSGTSDWITPSGFTFYSLAKIRDRIKGRNFNADFVTDDQINDAVNEWLEKMTNVAIDVNEDYSLGTVDVSFSGTSELATITSSDFKEIRRVWFTTNGTDFYKASKKHITDFLPHETFNETHPYYYMQGDNVIGRKPADTSGTARIVYYKLTPVLVNDTDEVPVSMKGYTKTFVDYGDAMVKRLDSKISDAQMLMSDAKEGMETFRNEITPRSKSGPQYITTLESVDAEDSFELF